MKRIRILLLGLLVCGGLLPQNSFACPQSDGLPEAPQMAVV